MSQTTLSDEQPLRAETRKLLDEFGAVFDAETVREALAGELERHRDARIRTFVPVLAYRYAREALRERARAEGRPLSRAS